MLKQLWRDKYFIILIFLFFLLLLDRCLLLFNFSFNYTDSDQTLLWHACKDVLNLKFYEPCFYGQSYSSCLEAYMATPLVAFGLPLYYALPIVTQFIGIFPFLLFGIIFFKKELKLSAIFCLAIPLFFPMEYVFISALPRGFLTGCFFASISVGIYWFAKNNSYKYVLMAAFGILGLTLNPNCVLLLLPFALDIFVAHYRSLKFYTYTIAGALIGSTYFLIIKWFYDHYPSYDLFTHPPVEFDYLLFKKALFHLDDFFFGQSLFIFSIFLLLLIMLFLLDSKRRFIIALISVLFIFCALGINRVNIGEANVMYSYGRMFLAIPLLLVLFMSWAEQLFQQKKYIFIHKVFAVSFILFAVMGFSCRQLNLTAYADEVVYTKTLIQVVNVEEYKNKRIQPLIDLSKKYNSELVWIFRYEDVLLYALPPLSDNKVQTFYPNLDRRTWRFYEESEVIRKNILLFGPSREIIEKFKTNGYVPQLIASDIYLLKINATPMSIVKKLGLACRKY